MHPLTSLIRSKPFLITAVFVLIYLLVILSRVVWQNYQVNLQVVLLENQVQTLKESNDELKAKILYYQTPSYLEKEARSKLGLQKPGEEVVIVPSAKPKQTTAPQKETQKNQPNWQTWWEFFFGPDALGQS